MGYKKKVRQVGFGQHDTTSEGGRGSLWGAAGGLKRRPTRPAHRLVSHPNQAPLC